METSTTITQDRRMVYQPPTAAAIHDHAVKTLAHIAWIKNMAAHCAAHESAWSEYGLEMQRRNAVKADRRMEVENQRKADTAAEEQRKRKARKQREESAVLAANLVGNYHGVIQAEISAILGGGL